MIYWWYKDYFRRNFIEMLFFMNDFDCNIDLGNSLVPSSDKRYYLTSFDHSMAKLLIIWSIF